MKGAPPPPLNAKGAMRPSSRAVNWPLRISVVIACLVGLSFFCVDHLKPSHVFEFKPGSPPPGMRVADSKHRPHHHSPGFSKSLHRSGNGSVYGQFPKPNDPFRFLPCTRRTVLPALNDTNPSQTWSDRFDPDPSHWSWGNTTKLPTGNDTYAGRGIYLCGYLDVPLDYTNKSDPRITRLAVTKYQVSGLARAESHAVGPAMSSREANDGPTPGSKSERTIIIEPGGPGGSGTSYAWSSSESISKRLSDGKFDVLGWDPRGVNASLPAMSCFPYDADRDRWSLITSQYYEVSASPKSQLLIADTFNDATWQACKAKHGDIPRFVTTAFVARDLEEIRKALNEADVTGYMVSYGTGIGQTYVSMFPSSSGRIILDGTEYVRDHRVLGGFGWTALDNGTNAWHDGFLGECIKAGPDHCDLAKPRNGQPVTLSDLDKRMTTLITSLVGQPIPVHNNFSGPSILTYSALVQRLYGAMYNARSWPVLATVLADLENGNTTLAAAVVEDQWDFNPIKPCSLEPPAPSSGELTSMVVCGDSYDAPLPPGGDTLDFYANLWQNMTARSWIAGNSRFYNVFPCRHFPKYWQPAEVYRGDLNKTLKHPVLLIAETYDPATPLRNGRRLLEEMGANARLIAHHGYGHSSRDTSNCTDALAKAFILDGKLPDQQETACYADEKPYLYGIKANATAAAPPRPKEDPIAAWQDHLEVMAVLEPQLAGRNSRLAW